MKIFPLLFFIYLEIPRGKAELQISPQVVAYVEENNSLTFTCTATALQYSLVSWGKAGGMTSNDVLKDTCVDFNKRIDSAIYQFSCSGNLFNWTILQVTKQQHGDEWFCWTNDLQGTESTKTRIFVKVPVTTVAFFSPPGTSVAVTENVSKKFQCTTSEERPRSTIQWYITQNSVSLGTGTIAPTDNDTLTSTSSTLSYSFNRDLSGRHVYCTAFNIDGQTPIGSSRKEIIVEYGTNGPPEIVGFTNGAIYKAILSESQSLLCTVTGGYPTPALTWDCFSGNVTNETGGENEVRKRITWTASNNGSSTCRCLSDQKVSGQQVFMLTVNVLYPPSTPKFAISTTRVSGTVKVIRGRNIIVKCESSSNPDPSYEWSNNVGGQSLSLQSVSQSDEKSYTCTATNTMVPTQGSPQTDSASSSFILNVLFPPDTPTFKVGTQLISGDLSVVKGDNVQVTCEATSDPGPPTYGWTGQSSGISVLTINSIQSEVTKTCTATNTMNPTAGSIETVSSNAALKIIVMSGPTVPVIYILASGSTTHLPDEQLLVINGTQFSLSCSGSDSIPAPTYRWSGKKTSDNNMVSFTSISTTDDGQYTCIVENTMVRSVGNPVYGNNSDHVVIEILSEPEVDALPDQTVKENHPLSVPCKANGNPEPASFTWTRSKDGFRQTQSTIFIQNTRREDTDTYTCTAHNVMRPTVGGQTPGVGSERMNVKILYHPDVTISALNGTILTETATNVMLLCSAKGEPREYNFSKWIQYSPDGLTKIKEYDSSRIEGGNAYLTFASVSYMDSGIYHCFVKNGIEDYRTGNATATNNTVQIVKGKPVVTGGEKDVAAAKHDNSSLWVEYYSNDEIDPSVKWYKLKNEVRYNLSSQDGKFMLETGSAVVDVNYHSVPVSQQGNRTQLLIQNISDSDFGDYEVEISNNIGSITWKFNFVARGAPDTPKMLRAISESATQTSILLSWRSGFHGGANQTFYIQYKTATTAWQNKSDTDGGFLNDADFNVTIDKLEPGTFYSFRIFAANVYDRSGFSTSIDATTRKPEEPDGGGGSLIGPAVGGGVGGALVIIAIVALVVFVRKRRLDGGSAGTQKKILLDGNKSKNGARNNDDLEEVPNPMYEPAGAFQSTSNTTQNAGIKNELAADLYATPMKTNGKNKKQITDIYSIPQKTKGGKKQSPGDLYSVPVKNKGKQKYEKNQKEKKTKQKKNKDHMQGNVNEGMVYENAAELAAGAADTENAYEMTEAPESSKPSRTQNADGLIYLEIDVSRNKDATGNRPFVIRGLEDRSDYADIAFGKVGEQAPESEDEEKPKEDTNEG